MIRHVSIKMREDIPLNSEEEWRKPSHRHGLVDVADESTENAKPQADPEDSRPSAVGGAGRCGSVRDARRSGGQGIRLEVG